MVVGGYHSHAFLIPALPSFLVVFVESLLLLQHLVYLSMRLAAQSSYRVTFRLKATPTALKSPKWLHFQCFCLTFKEIPGISS